MVFIKKSTVFLYVFFQPKKPERNIFFSFWIVKNAFQTRKVKFQESKKNRHFAKGQYMVFVKKSTFSSYVFFFSKKSHKKHFLIFWKEHKVFWTSKMKFSQSRKKNDILQRGQSMVFVKTSTFFLMFFFLSKKSHKETFFDILVEENAFQTTKENF